MNMKKTVRKMSAVLTGATMVGATVMGAMALDLSDYPSPFIQDGFFEGHVVIGEKAAPIDTIGATDIIAAMQADAVTPVGTDGTVTVTGGVTEEVALAGTGLFSEWGTALDNDDVPGLKEGTITFQVDSDRETYDFHEEISFGSGDFVLNTAVSADDEDFEDGVYATLDEGAIRYSFVFEEVLDGDLSFQDVTSEDTVTLNILGMEVEVSDVDADTLTITTGETVYLAAGESQTVAGQEVTLVRVGDDVAVVSVDGTTETISTSDGEEYVNGLNIEVVNVFNDDGTADDEAELRISTDDEDEYSTGDAFIGEDEDEPNWVWELANLNSTTVVPTIAVVWDPTINDLEDEPAPITIGESIALPNNYAKVSLVSFNQEDSQVYTVEVDEEDLYVDPDTTATYDNVEVLVLSSEGNDAFSVAGQDTSRVAIWQNATHTNVAYEDEGNSNKMVIGYANTTALAGADTAIFTLTFQDSEIDVAYNGSLYTLTVDLPTEDLIIDGTSDFGFLGQADGDDTVTGDVLLGATSIVGYEEDVMTEDGVVLYSYDASASSDEFSFSIPEDVTDFAVNVAVTGGSGSTGSSSTGSYRVNPIPTGATILDKDAMRLLGTDTPLLVVGGPSINTVAAELMGNPTREEINELFSAGTAIIKLYEDQNALLVAGYEGQDTLGAAYVLKDYQDYSSKLVGDEVLVVVPSLTDLDVQTPQ